MDLETRLDRLEMEMDNLKITMVETHASIERDLHYITEAVKTLPEIQKKLSSSEGYRTALNWAIPIGLSVVGGLGVAIQLIKAVRI